MRSVAAALALLFCSTHFSVLGAAQQKAVTRGALHGAIAYHQGSGSVGWATERGTSREARLEALKQCGHERCVVVATATRNCAALAKNPKKFAAQRGTTRQEAETKALGKCGAGCEVAAWICTR